MKAMRKYLLIIAIIAVCSCQKQAQIIAEEEISDTALIMVEEPSQEVFIEPAATVVIYSSKYSQEDIIGAWWLGTPRSTIEIEFTNDNILYIREFDIFDNSVDENFYPYKIENDSLIIEDTDKSNNFVGFVNDYFLASGAGIYIAGLDARSLNLVLRGNRFQFYKGSMQEQLESLNKRISYENELKDFIYNEVLKGIIYQGDIEDENGVIDTYGEPLKDEIIEYSDGLQYEGGRTLIGIREIRYEDLTHRYFVFVNRRNIQSQSYKDVLVNTKLDRLTTINIGARSEDIMAVFGRDYWRKEGEDLMYMWNLDISEPYRWVRFTIENDIVISISYILTRWSSE
ncbi:MAG: hypothetical protein LBI14_11475 [Treponema sp.]|jgi:hypothetical protein|nr:hypothetical protein [Treponema sp.]